MSQFDLSITGGHFSPVIDNAPGASPSREEVAVNFERHLVENLVATLMQGILEEPLNGSGPLAKAGRAEQKQAWVSQLSDYLTSQGGLGLSEKLLAQWEARFGPAASDANEVSITTQP